MKETCGLLRNGDEETSAPTSRPKDWQSPCSGEALPLWDSETSSSAVAVRPRVLGLAVAGHAGSGRSHGED